MPLERQSGASATAARYMLDTDTCSHVMKRSHALVLKRLQSLSVSDVCMSVVTKAELPPVPKRPNHRGATCPL